MTKHDLARELDDLADRIRDIEASALTAAHGVTADFIQFEDDDLPEIPDGWTWEHREHEGEHGASFMVATREDNEQ